MTKDPVKAVLQRVSTWPEERQQELAELALEIAAELAGAEYDATSDELAAFDEGLAGEAAREEEVKVTFAVFRRQLLDPFCSDGNPHGLACIAQN
jgi:hypothetical protein